MGEPRIIDSFLRYETGTDSTISELVAEMKPRSSIISYHIADTKDIYYACEHYSNVDAVHGTRFLGLASVRNRDKQYWRYDASRKWQKHEEDGNKLIMSMGGKCRFRHGVDARDQFLRGVCYHFINKGKCERGPDCSYKRSLQDEGESMSTKRSRADSARSNSEGFSLHGFFKSKGCWFCLLRPSVGLHLLISIGENYYCTLAKGPLVQVQGHVLLVPIEHLSNTLSLAFNRRQKSREVIFIEWIQKVPHMLNFRQYLFHSPKHLFLKIFFIWLPRSWTNSSEGRRLLKSQFDKEHSFFYVELPDCTMLSDCMEENENFPVQFG
ncbi:Cwf19-like, C-terminal domain-1 [Dillenia turbinata]|uniref:Cwf19-like, C-terminal domain-1 n=1 Tax=Dillenia turbinata TaxID=194707 RepID=A0AAN8V4X3_9MAGN